MKIADVIKELNIALEDGLEYVSTDSLGGFNLIYSEYELNESDENHVYVTILHPELEKSGKDITIEGEGKDYAHIKCKVIATRIRYHDEPISDDYECVFDVEPVEELPEWYVGNENEIHGYYDEDYSGGFRGVRIYDINRRLGTYILEIRGL